jgi:hypothetical protein
LTRHDRGRELSQAILASVPQLHEMDYWRTARRAGDKAEIAWLAKGEGANALFGGAPLKATVFDVEDIGGSEGSISRIQRRRSGEKALSEPANRTRRFAGHE